MTNAVEIQSLSKKYILGSSVESDSNFREMLTGALLYPLRRFRRLSEKVSEEDIFWALKDVSFEVRQGQAVGIIGRNGAGKSTLLKVLSRITEPTLGEVQITGRVGSLLEVGTGFHPELTGRENVYLNGSVLGMSRAEVRAKYDEIVAFADIDAFLDTPVKRYSSGMYVRLAFAVAAHLEPDVLIIDEVLAVGDTAFQKKCIGKMNEVASQGRTVLFVSHNLTAVSKLCQHAILLDHGKLITQGETSEVISTYLNIAKQRRETPLAERKDRAGDGLVRFVDVEQLSGGKPCSVMPVGTQATFRLQLENETKGGLDVAVALYLDDEMGRRVASVDTVHTHGERLNLPPGKSWVTVQIPSLPLLPGTYAATLQCYQLGTNEDLIEDAFELTVEGGDFFGSGSLPHPSNGRVLFPHHIEVEP